MVLLIVGTEFGQCQLRLVRFGDESYVLYNLLRYITRCLKTQALDQYLFGGKVNRQVNRRQFYWAILRWR